MQCPHTGLPRGPLHGSYPLHASVREFPDLPRVAGIAIADGERFFYVTDEDEGAQLRLTRLVADQRV
jgi:hypothetical protein